LNKQHPGEDYMAYMNQEKKAAIKVELDKVLKGTGIKYSLGVRNHSTLVLNISIGPIDFIGNYLETVRLLPGSSYRDIEKVPTYIDVNTYHYKDHYTGKALEIINACVKAMNQGNHDKSDSQSDYYDVGWYIDINIGKWDKPYELTA